MPNIFVSLDLTPLSGPGLVDLYDGQDPLSAAGIGAFDIMADPVSGLSSTVYGRSSIMFLHGRLTAFVSASSTVRSKW